LSIGRKDTNLGLFVIDSEKKIFHHNSICCIIVNVSTGLYSYISGNIALFQPWGWRERTMVCTVSHIIHVYPLKQCAPPKATPVWCVMPCTDRATKHLTPLYVNSKHWRRN